MSTLHIVLGLVVLQRLGELWLARRNTARLLEQGAVEAGRKHYPLLVALHVAWLAALALLVPAEAAPSLPLLALFVAAQAARVWIIASLGRFWTTRVITLPGVPLIRRGPYRFLRHPNYLVVAIEIALLPLAFGALWIALVFSLLNALVLWHRIRVEESANAGR